MPIPIYQVDAFTDKPFAGNPAAVCWLEEPHEERWMKNVAREMNLSETAFLSRGPECFVLRWFTPEAEVDLCGHATLASAHILWTEGYLPAGQPARFMTRSGLLTAAREGKDIRMDFPSTPAKLETASPAMLTALGNPQALFTGRTRWDFLIEIESERAVKKLQPDFALLAGIAGVRGVIVTAPATMQGCDFVSRFFAPGVGVPEDPVTGSAHCALAPFWAERLGKSELVGYQASRRGGIVKTRVAGDHVHLIGQAVTVLRGELLA